MSKYKLIIRKDDIELKLETNDKDFIETELGSWILLASTSLDAESAKTSDNIENESLIHQKSESDLAPIEKITTQDTTNTPIEEPAFIDEETKEALLKTLEKPEVKIEEKEELKQIEDETKEILRKAIHQTDDSDENLFSEENASPPEEMEIVEDFSKVFKEKVEKTKDIKTKQESSSSDNFANLVGSKKIKNNIDCLIACAFHLVEVENFERFTLKQINTLAKALIKESIEHDTVKAAMDKNLIKIVPDYTGMAETIEYTITEAGIGYFKDELE